MNCSNCNSEIIETDICGYGCVSCFNTNEPYQETLMSCFACGSVAPILYDNQCKECYLKWISLDENERRKIINMSWHRKSKEKIQ